MIDGRKATLRRWRVRAGEFTKSLMSFRLYVGIQSNSHLSKRPLDPGTSPE